MASTNMDFDFESYRIEYSLLPQTRHLSGGAQGTVFESEIDGRPVAVKVMHGMVKWDEDLAKLKMKLTITHENIVKTLRFCRLPYCLVMELCKCSLFDLIHSDKQITSDEFCNWSIQIATGMEYLHSNRITHRDLKSLNILLTFNDITKLCDFDQARMITASHMKLQTKTGTLLWAAPESLRDEEYTKSVDVWGFAIVIWELITQLSPYNVSNSHQEIIAVNLIAKCEYRLNYPTGLPQCLRVLMMSCLNSDANKRPKFDKILKVFKNIVIDKEIWNYMKPFWKTTKYDYSYDAEKQKHFDDARAIADKKARRIRQYFEEFVRKGRNLLDDGKCKVRKLTEVISTHDNFMETFTIEKFVENEPLIDNLRPMIEEGERLLDELLEHKNEIIAKISFSENFASYILISLTNQINNLNSVDLNALIQGTDFLFILLQQETIDSHVYEQAFEIIAKAIKTTNEKLTQNCCDLLKLPEMEVEILKRKVPTAEILLETLKRHLGDKNIATSSIFLLEILILNMNGEERNKINDKGLIELILKYLNDNSSFTIVDSQLVYDCWRILSCATITDNVKDAKRFVSAVDFFYFRRYQRQFFENVDILFGMVVTIRRISRYPNLRNHFFNDDSVPLLVSILDVHVDCTYLSYQTAWILAYLYEEKDSLCKKAGMNELEIGRKITQAILSWDILADLPVVWNTFSYTIACLSQSKNLFYQLLDVWTLANLVLTKSAQYCPLFIDEGGLPRLQQLLENPQTSENVRFYAQIAHEKLKKWQQISIGEWQLSLSC